MLYLISGASRSGKSLLAKRLLSEKNIPYLSLDWLMMGFNHGIPEYGIHHLLWPHEIAERMEPFLRGAIDSMMADDTDHVIEGEAMLPAFAAELAEKYPGEVRSVFLGFGEIAADDKVTIVKKHSYGESDWLANKSDDYIIDHIQNMIAYSKTIREGCEECGVPYVETSGDFLEALEEAMGVLVGGVR